MDIQIIEDRVRRYYNPISKKEELNAFKEIFQEITLLALSRTDFFKHAAFQGGTCLRIAYGIPRFSEDLDFILFEPNPHFVWQHYLHEIQQEFSSFGLKLTVKDRSIAETAVKKAFLKENSFGQVLQLSYTRDRSDVQGVQIKLEIDTNPPKGSDFETKFVEFPTLFSIVTQKESSLFAGKLHALLCREYIKGRDWYDFIWYMTRNTAINYAHLKYALMQQGPWARETLSIDRSWLCHELKKKIHQIDWKVAAHDVEVFLKPKEMQSLSLWSSPLFEHFIDKIPE